MDTLWYFAYGTNMSSKVLARRGLTPKQSKPGMVAGYRLSFSHAGLLPIEPAFANIEPDESACVHGVLHLMSPHQLKRLDRYEGAEYRHVDVTVATGGGDVTALAYLDPNIVLGIIPSRRYLRTCCQGAREFGVPEEYVRTLESNPSLHWPIVSDIANLFVKSAERLRHSGLRPERLRMAWRALRR